ncbi:MAG TPA: hypothetical protein VFV08_16685, partial [Puia sp.]|nr:hypothetical protein [Puia sp.]
QYCYRSNKCKPFTYKISLYQDCNLHLHTMKFIGFILAIYVLVLSATPCCDKDCCTQDKTEQGTNHHDNNCKGDCSPFFACGSCAGFTVTPNNFSIVQIKLFAQTEFSDFYLISSSAYFSSFWQPPRLA